MIGWVLGVDCDTLVGEKVEGLVGGFYSWYIGEMGEVL